MKKSTKRKLGTGLMVTAGVLLLAGTVALGVKTKGFTDWKWAGNMTKLGEVVERFEATGISEGNLILESTKSELLYTVSSGVSASDGAMVEDEFILGAEESENNDSAITANVSADAFTNSQLAGATNNVVYNNNYYFSSIEGVFNIDSVITDEKDDDSTLLKVKYFDVIRINFTQDVGHQIMAWTSYSEDEETKYIGQQSYKEESKLNSHIDLKVLQPTKALRNPSCAFHFYEFGLNGEQDTRMNIDSIELVKTSVGHAKEYRYVSFGL